MGETLLYKSKLKLGGQIGTSLALALICLAVLWRGGFALAEHPAGALGVLVFGLGAAFGIRDWVRRQPILVLDRQGVSGPGLGAIRFIPWHAIERIALADRRRRAVLLAIDEKRLSDADRALMQLRDQPRDSDGYLATRIKVRELAIGAPALATLLAEHVRAAEAAA
jgi:hypothetical protein